jgi:hypothetical protein
MPFPDRVSKVSLGSTSVHPLPRRKKWATVGDGVDAPDGLCVCQGDGVEQSQKEASVEPAITRGGAKIDELRTTESLSETRVFESGRIGRQSRATGCYDKSSPTQVADCAPAELRAPNLFKKL